MAVLSKKRLSCADATLKRLASSTRHTGNSCGLIIPVQTQLGGKEEEEEERRRRMMYHSVFIDGHLQSRILLSSVDREKAECVAIAPVSSVSSFVWRPPL